MPQAFTRQLGAQPGVQLNPTVDQSDGFSASNQDQKFAIAGRFKRGRIDRPFAVDRSNQRRKLGINDSLRSSLLNEAYEHVYEALQRGAYQAIVYRLTTSAAVVKWTVYDATPAVVTPWTVATAAPTTGYTIALKHLDCYNDGVILQIHADEVLDEDMLPIPAKVVQLYAVDPASFEVILSLTGSLDPDAIDEFGNSAFIADKLAEISDAWEIRVATGATIPILSDSYGVDASLNDKYVDSGVLVCFEEGGTGYVAADYDRAISALRYTDLDYSYIAGGGSRAPALIQRLAQLAYDTNRHLRIDVPGEFAPDAAITWLSQLALDSQYVGAFWAPLNADTPSGGGKNIVGSSGIHIGFSCRRNAQRNAKGFAPKNYPIAGRAWAVDRTGIKQIYTPTEQELSALAKAKIIPVIYQVYNGGSSYVFSDVLSSRKVQNSLLKLLTVAEMASEIDDGVTRMGKELQLLPQKIYISRMQEFLNDYLGDAEASGWLTPSSTLDGGAAFSHSVRRAEDRPADTAYIDYFCCYDGVNRQSYVTQNIVR